MNTTLVLIDYAAIAVIVYIALTVLSRAVLLAVWTYMIKEYIKAFEYKDETSSVKSDQFNPNLDF